MPSFLPRGLGLALVALVPSFAACVEATDDEPSGATESAQTTLPASCSVKLPIKAVTASGAQSGAPATNAIDGNLATRWSENAVGATITADLGTAQQVCATSIAWYDGSARTAKFSVEVSTDGTTFLTVASGASSGTTEALQATSFGAVTARYVRVTVDGNSVNDWASIDELTVSGSSGAFVHPGVLDSTAQLDLVKGKIAAGAPPWKHAFDEMAGSKYAATTYTAKPRATIECGPSSGPDYGCTQESDDAHAAYANALLWYYTGVTAHADKAIQILNAYAATVKAHTNSNAPLQASWASERFVRAAEIIRHTSTQWAAADIARFVAFIRGPAYLGLVENGWAYGNGNWDLSMIDATISIAVFTDDRATFDKAVALWKQRVPAYIYLTKDGPLPVRPTRTSDYASANAILKLWEWQTNTAGNAPKYPFVDGVIQESCRDFNHSSLGMTAMTDAAETAYVQGVDLYSYSDFETRITKAIELQSEYIAGAPMPVSFCGGEAAHRPEVGFLTKAPYAVALNFAVAYNHYANRLGVPLPYTKAALADVDNNGSDYRSKVGPTASWENLTSPQK